MGVLSYWDAGFTTLDLSDPSNPQFIGDSDHPNPDPITGLPYEGNAHAAVFVSTDGTNGEYTLGGDEDFDALETALEYLGELYAVGLAGYDSGSGQQTRNEEGVGLLPGRLPPPALDPLQGADGGSKPAFGRVVVTSLFQRDIELMGAGAMVPHRLDPVIELPSKQVGHHPDQHVVGGLVAAGPVFELTSDQGAHRKRDG